LAFAIWAVPVTVWGLHPELGVPRLSKLLWFAGIPAAATLVRSERRLGTLLACLAAGAGILSLRVLTARAGLVWEMIQGDGGAATARLVHLGSMTDAQRLMIGILVTTGFLFTGNGRRARGWLWLLLAIQSTALLLQFKRGSWICTVAVVGVLLARRANGKVLAALALIVIGALCLPPVRARVGELKTELSAQKGGRVVMWTRITPAIVREHPWGIGWRSLTNEMMRDIAPAVEPRRVHLHSNPAEILVATGWLGLAVYLAWMAAALRDAGRFCRQSRTPVEQGYALVLLLMFAGLLVNGLVEFNFGDGEIVLLYGLIMGCAAAGSRRTVAEATGTSTGRSALPA